MDTLYCFTAIEHGKPTDQLDPFGKPIIKTVSFAVGDVFDGSDFTETEIANLIQAGALSRVNPIVVEAPPLTAEDAAAIAAASGDKSPAETPKK